MMTVSDRSPSPGGHAGLYHDLAPHFPALRQARSQAELERSPIYRELEPRIRALLGTSVVCNPVDLAPHHPDFYRVCVFNIERGVAFDGVLALLCEHPILSTSDIFILVELDVGMARTGNRDVPRDLSQALGLNHVYGPSFIELGKGLGPERLVAEDNTYGLHGTAILSRFPLSDPELVPLENGMDRMASPEPRIGSETSVLATAHTPDGPLRVAAVHLDVRCSRRHRQRQMESVLARLERTRHIPTLLGGDWNTHTLNAQNGPALVASLWWRFLIGWNRVTERHHAHPDQYQESGVFRALERAGFAYRDWNTPGVPTIRNDLAEDRFRSCFVDGKPRFTLPIARLLGRSTGGRFPFKLDWVAGRGLVCVHQAPARPPAVISALHHGAPVSDHDAIVADFRPA